MLDAGRHKIMFLKLARLAFRNVSRNTKRSLITMAAVIIGCAAIVFARGFVKALHKAMVDGITQTRTGDVQVHRRGYLEAGDALPLNLALPLDGRLERVIGQDPRVDAWSARIAFAGVLSNGLHASPVVGNAIDPDHEYLVTPDARQDVQPGGQAISTANPYGVVMADRLASAMGISVGDVVTLTATTRDGALNTIDLTVVGIRRAATELTGTEGKMIDMTLPAAQELLYMPGEATEVVINVTDFERASEVARDLQQRLNTTAPELEAEANDWQAVSGFFLDVLTMQDLVLWIVILVLFAVMVTGIVNTMLMAVMERVREVGTMMAFGVRRKRIMVLFLWEAVMLGAIGAVIGALLGYALVLIFGVRGIQFQPATYSKPLFIRPYIGPEFLLLVVGIAIVAAVLAALYPARRASRLEPATALRAT